MLTGKAQQLAAATQHTRGKMLQAIRDNNPRVTDEELEAGMQSIAGTIESILFPQSIAGLTGLRKLIEKDRSRDEETVFHYNPAIG